MQRKHGFTLVELLVVIGIISVLVAMLLPALNKARQSAKTVACLSNMRQLGMAFQMYTDQFDNSFMPYNQLNSAGVQEKWAGILIGTRCLASAAVFHCPSHDNAWPDFRTMYISPTATETMSAWEYVDYGYNYCDIGSSIRLYPSSNPAYYTPAKRNQIRQPTQTILLADTVALFTATVPADPVRGWYYAYDQVIYAPSGKNGYTCDPRHNGGNAINVLWVDGHASTLQLDSRDKGQNPPNPVNTLTKWSSTANNYWDRK